MDVIFDISGYLFIVSGLFLAVTGIMLFRVNRNIENAMIATVAAIMICIGLYVITLRDTYITLNWQPWTMQLRK